MTPTQKAQLAQSKQELAGQFARRRCHCGCTNVVAVLPGSEEVREAGILLKAAVPDRNFCLEHAVLWCAEEGRLA